MIRDPGLTERGLEECRNLSERFPYHSSIDLIVSSPLRRALHTALCSFQPAIARGIKIVALPELQETSDIVCDEGSEKSDLEREFADAKGPSGENVVDLGLLYEGWWVKVSLLTNRHYRNLWVDRCFFRIKERQIRTDFQRSHHPRQDGQTMAEGTPGRGDRGGGTWRSFPLPHRGLDWD